MKIIIFLILFTGLVLCNRKYFQAHEATINDIHKAILNKEVTCTEVIKAHFERIYKYNKKLNCVINNLEEQAYRRARQLDQYFLNNGKLVGPLHCIPVAAKDNYDVADAPTTGGVKALEHSVPKIDSSVVSSLHSKGAITITKVALPDFSGDGFKTVSSMIGLTLNPYNYNVTTYGSSGGTGSSIAASFAVIGLGSDTSGSIQNPSSAGNLVGMRPTFGLVPSAGVLPLYFNQDSCGPMTRTVEDLAKTLEHMVNPIYKDKGPQNYVDHLNPNALQGARLALEFSFLGNFTLGTVAVSSTQEVVDRFNEADGIFRNAGATIVSSSVLLENYFYMINVRNLHPPYCDVWTFKTGVEQYLSNIPNATYTKLSQIYATGKFHPSMDYVQKAAVLDPSITSSSCDAYLDGKKAFADNLERMMNQLDVDAIVFPAQNRALPPLSLDNFGAFVSAGYVTGNEFAAVAGLPTITIPMRITGSNGAPIGMTLLGRRYQEARLISLAYAFQNKHSFRVPPPNTPPIVPIHDDEVTNHHYNNHNQHINNNDSSNNDYEEDENQNNNHHHDYNSYNEYYKKK